MTVGCWPGRAGSARKASTLSPKRTRCVMTSGWDGSLAMFAPLAADAPPCRGGPDRAGYGVRGQPERARGSRTALPGQEAGSPAERYTANDRWAPARTGGTVVLAPAGPEA